MEPNPVFLKEIRQMSRSRLLVSLLLLCLLGTGVGTILYLQWPEIWKAVAGRRPGIPLAVLTATVLTGGLAAAGADALGRTTQEWSPAARDLLFTTPLSASRMALGKFLASLVVVGFLASLGVPFLFEAFVLRGFSLESGGLLLATLFCFGLLVQGVAAFSSILSPPRVVRMVGLGYFLVFGLWRLVYSWMIPSLLPSLGYFLFFHALLAWVGIWLLLSLRQEGHHGAQGTTPAPGNAKAKGRGALPRAILFICMGLTLAIAAGYDFRQFSSRSELMWFALAGHGSTLLGVVGIGLLGTSWSERLAQWRPWRRTPAPAAASAAEAPASPAPRRSAQWLLDLLAGLLPARPASEAVAEPPRGCLYRFFDRSEWNPVFAKAGRALSRSQFFISYPIVAVCFTLSSWGLFLFFEYVMEPYFIGTYLIIATLPPLFFWSISYEVFLRGLSEWGGEAGHADLVHATPLKPFGLLAGILALGLLVLPLAILASWPSLFFSKQIFWQNLSHRSTLMATFALAMQAVCIYLWTLAMALWRLPGHLKTAASALLFVSLGRHLIFWREEAIYAYAGFGLVFLAMIHFFLTSPRHRRRWPLVLGLLLGLALLFGQQDVRRQRLSSLIPFQIATWGVVLFLLRTTPTRRRVQSGAEKNPAPDPGTG